METVLFICERLVFWLSGALIVWETVSQMVMSRVLLYPYVFAVDPNKHGVFVKVSDLAGILTY